MPQPSHGGHVCLPEIHLSRITIVMLVFVLALVLVLNGATVHEAAFLMCSATAGASYLVHKLIKS